MAQMNETRLLAIVEAYGAEPNRWPEEERAAAQALHSPAGHQALASTAALDWLLSESLVAPADLALITQIITLLEQRSNGLTVLTRPFGAIWQPAMGLATAAIIGIVVGVATPPEQIPMNQGQSETYVMFITAAGGNIEELLQ